MGMGLRKRYDERMKGHVVRRRGKKGSFGDRVKMAALMFVETSVNFQQLTLFILESQSCTELQLTAAMRTWGQLTVIICVVK
jgi:hypothetical protein